MHLKKLIILGIFFLFLSNTAFAQSLSSIELINNAKKYDVSEVVYSGEVVGDVMARGDNAWINVNDGSNAIGVWLDSKFAEGLFFKGSYKSKGDKVEAHGIFHSSCSEHGGDLDIHADKFFVLNSGGDNIEPVNIIKRNVSFILVGFAFVLWLLMRKT